MFYIVYKTTNLINGKYYIGKHKTSNLLDGYMGSGKLLQRAIKKYGTENFSKEILFVFDTEDQMNEKEKELVVLSEETYNLCPGGQGGFGYINTKRLWDTPKHLAAARNNSIAATKRAQELTYEDPAWRDNRKKNIRIAHHSKKDGYVNPFLGKKHKPETISKLCNLQKQKGSRNSQFGTIWINNGKDVKKIKSCELETWISMGYTKGRSIG